MIGLEAVVTAASCMSHNDSCIPVDNPHSSTGDDVQVSESMTMMNT